MTDVAAAWVTLAVCASFLLVGTLAVLPLRVRAASPRPAWLLGLLVGSGLTLLLAVVVRSTTSSGNAPERLWVVGGLMLLPAALTLYPDGRPPAGLGRLVMVPLLTPGALALAYPATYARTGLAALVAVLLLGSVLWWRYEHGPQADRLPILWLTLGVGGFTLLGSLAGFALDPWLVAATCSVLAAAAMGCLVTGLVDPGRWDVRAATVATVVHVVTALALIAALTTLTAAVELTTGDPITSTGALGLVVVLLAAGYHPVTRLLRGVTDLMLFGDRRPALEAVSRVGAGLEAGPERALGSLRESLALPYAAMTDVAGAVVAASGLRPGRVVELPLRMSDPGLGRLVIGLRRDEVQLSALDRQVLEVVSSTLAQLMLVRALSDELATSRTQVVLAVEDERRRLRRDLHDGLGPRLTGIAYTADAARNHLPDRERVDDLLAGLREDAADAIAEVRRLVEGLRPPMLDQVGLVEALRQHGESLHGPEGRPLAVRLESEEPLGPLGAAVEVAAYRIAVEALTNAARHSGGSGCEVRLRRTDGQLVVEVSDDGPGDREVWRPGAGLTSMKERSELLGGTFSAGGGRVRATLPV